MIYRGKTGLRYNLSDTPLPSDNENEEIYNIIGQPNLLAKIYKSGKATQEEECRLVKMIDSPLNAELQPQGARPKDILYNLYNERQFAGFVVPNLTVNEDLNAVYENVSTVKCSNEASPVATHSLGISREGSRQIQLSPLHFLPIVIPVVAILVFIVWEGWAAVLMNVIALVLAVTIIPKERLAFRIMAIMHTSFWTFITFSVMLLGIF